MLLILQSNAAIILGHLAAVAYNNINPLNAKLNPICHLLALLGGATMVVVSRLRVKMFAEQTKVKLY